VGWVSFYEGNKVGGVGGSPGTKGIRLVLFRDHNACNTAWTGVDALKDI
jgi:hypothetical protein